MDPHASPDPAPPAPPPGGERASAHPVAVTAAFLLLAGGAAVASLPFLGRSAPEEAVPAEPPPVLAEVPPFSFTERNGATVTRDDLLGKIWVIDFIFTRCAGICPEMTFRMAGVHNVLRKDPDALCVSVTVDPKNDTPEVLREYADRYGASGDRWLFLRGPEEDVHALAYGGFRIGDEKDLFIHSMKFVLVDREGRTRGYYTGTDPKDVSRLLADYRRLRRGEDQ